MTKELSEEEIEEILKTFVLLDVKKTDTITSNDVIKGIRLLRVYPTEQEAKEVIEKLTLDDEGLVNLEEFKKAVSPKVLTRDYEQSMFMDAFQTLDKDNNGYIDKDEMRVWLQKGMKGKIWTDEDERDLEELFTDADVNGDNKIGYKEFVKKICEEDI